MHNVLSQRVHFYSLIAWESQKTLPSGLDQSTLEQSTPRCTSVGRFCCFRKAVLNIGVTENNSLMLYCLLTFHAMKVFRCVFAFRAVYAFCKCGCKFTCTCVTVSIRNESAPLENKIRLIFWAVPYFIPGLFGPL